MQKGLFAFLLFSCISATAQRTIRISSPDRNMDLNARISATGELSYTVHYKNRPVILQSSLGFLLKEPAVELKEFKLQRIDSSIVNQTWKPVWGEYATIRDHHKELRLNLQEQNGSGILINVVFRVFNEGIAFRYEFPKQDKLGHFVIADERSQFHLAGDHKTFWIPGDYDTNEYPYNTSLLSEVDASSGKFSAEIHAKTYFNKNAVQTPLMMKSGDGLYINIHEAGLLNYPAMNLVLDKSTFTLVSHLVPDAFPTKHPPFSAV